MSEGSWMIEFGNTLALEKAKGEILACNERSVFFGLILSENEAVELVESRVEALKSAGRIEFGGGILPKLIQAFCDSPFIHQENYVSMLSELQEAFYYYKTDAEDEFTDDELIDFMVKIFNGRARGSTEYLISTSLGALSRYARNGYDPADDENRGDLF